MWGLVENPEDRFSQNEAHIVLLYTRISNNFYLFQSVYGKIITTETCVSINLDGMFPSVFR